MQTGIPVADREARLVLSYQKTVAPYLLDPTLTFYCPQENLEAFEHPTVCAFHHFMQEEYDPQPPPNTTLLLLPCTKTKPYLLSAEHQAINSSLLAADYIPHGNNDVPDALDHALPADRDLALLHNGLLHRDDTYIQRMVISEPMSLVPYEYVYHWRGDISPVSRYDDPGLFEQRGNAVALWRSDSTAVQAADGSWRWGINERSAFVEVHNRLVTLITAILQRLAPRYRQIVAYVSPKLTHRSFLTSQPEKAAAGLTRTRQTSQGRQRLTGVNDLAPGLVRVVPNVSEWDEIRINLAARLRAAEPEISAAGIRTVFASGGGSATPLVLPEALAILARVLAG